MMIFLFSSSKAVLIACEALTVLFLMTRIYDGASLSSATLVVLIGSVISVIAANTYAGLLHHKALLVLYSLLQPDEFIRIYAPLSEQRWIPSNVRFTLRAYLSNGYAAKGDFVRAKALLDTAASDGKLSLDRQLVLCGNRASIALAEADAQDAAAQIELLAQLASGGRLPAKKLQTQQVILRTLRAQLNILSGTCTISDCDVLREESKKPGSLLRRTELGYYIGKAYALLGEPVLAREYLTPAAESKTVVYGKKAASALKELPSSAQPGSKKK